MGNVTVLSTNWVRRYPIPTIIAGSVLIRIIDLSLYALVAQRDGVTIPRLLRAWDGDWLYRAITEGWPDSLPLDESGTVAPSTWAWPPLFPLLVRFMTLPLGRDVISPTMIAFNLACSIAAAVTLWAVIRPTGGNGLAVLSALLWASMPSAPVFLMAYAEGLFILLAFVALLLAGRGNYVGAGLVLVLAGLTKSSVAPFAIALIVVVVAAHWRERRSNLSARFDWSKAVAVALSLLAIAIWPLIVAIRLGSPNAYALAQRPWSRSSIPGWDSLQLIWNTGTRSYEDPLMAFVLVAIALIAGIAILRDTRFPIMVRAVGIISPLFLITVGAGTSTARLLLPDVGIPSWLARIVSGRAALVGAFIGATLLLLIARFLWIAHYVSIAIAVPPP